VLPEDGDAVLVGITDYAQDQLGDVVFLDLPAEGAELTQYAKFGEIESVKAVSDLFSPVNGRVRDVNQKAVDEPELVNQEPYGAGWLLRVELASEFELETLLSAVEYEAFLADASTA
jgi:glycine cleavage system H protein